MRINNGSYIDFMPISKVSGDGRNGRAAFPGNGKTRGVLFPTWVHFKGRLVLINGQWLITSVRHEEQFVESLLLLIVS